MQIFKYRDSDEQIKFIQRALNEILRIQLKADGNFGKLTEEAIRAFQTRNRLTVNGVYGALEANLINPLIERKYLKEETIERMAIQNNLPVSIVKALRYVEARSDGFLFTGETIILFERHKFYRHLIRKMGQAAADNISRNNSDICNPIRGGYEGYGREYDRLNKAQQIDMDCAIKSCSYGLFQIMGEHHLLCGYHSPLAFKEAMDFSEINHLHAFINFVKGNPGLLSAVKQRNYEKIAILYNGKNAIENNYANKLREADSKFIR